MDLLNAPVGCLPAVDIQKIQADFRKQISDTSPFCNLNNVMPAKALLARRSTGQISEKMWPHMTFDASEIHQMLSAANHPGMTCFFQAFVMMIDGDDQ
jgi:hypothetical protein